MIQIANQPPLDESDVRQIAALTSRDTAAFLQMFITIARKLASYRIEADSLVATDSAGTVIFSLGSGGNIMTREMKTKWEQDNIGFSVLTNEVMLYSGRGVLRQIAFVVGTGITGGPSSEIASSVFAANLPLITAGVFSPEAKSRASRIQGDGSTNGDFIVLDFNTEFTSVLKVDHVGTVGGSGAAVMYVWYDRVV